MIEGSVSAHGTTFSSNGTLSINQGSLSISTSVSTLTAGTLAVNVPMYVNNGGHFVIADGATLGGSGILELQDGLVTIDGTLNKQVRIVGPVKVGRNNLRRDPRWSRGHHLHVRRRLRPGKLLRGKHNRVGRREY